MPPANNGCKFDESQWRDRIEETVWRSDDSLSKRITVLEERWKSQQRFLTVWLPVIFSIGTSGLFFLLQVLSDRFLKGG